jgi:hypothetical protein
VISFKKGTARFAKLQLQNYEEP